MRLVLDTNTALSGLLWRGTPGRLIDCAGRTHVCLVTSDALLAELRRVVFRPKFASKLAMQHLTADELWTSYVDLVLVVPPAVIAPTIASDPDDDHVLAAALGGRANLIVSGDAHLLDLRRFHDIEIVTAAEALDRIDAAA